MACALLSALLPGPLAVTPALGAGTNLGQGLFIECFATCALILSVLFLAVEKHRATFLAPLGIGITLFAGHMFVSCCFLVLRDFCSPFSFWFALRRSVPLRVRLSHHQGRGLYGSGDEHGESFWSSCRHWFWIRSVVSVGRETCFVPVWKFT